MTIAFIGHRKVPQANAVAERLRAKLRLLIESECADTFLFGSRGEFNALCYSVVTELKADYPNIKRIYVRAEYPHINDDYAAYLRTLYEYSYFPPQIEKAGYRIYVERNRILADSCDMLICYYNEFVRALRASGTYAVMQYVRQKIKEYGTFTGSKKTL